MLQSSVWIPRIVKALVLCLLLSVPVHCFAHGTVAYPPSRVYLVYQSNPWNPSFPLAANAVQIDGANSYYTWNEVSRNIPQAVNAGLPAGFDYSPWMPDGALASAGRIDPQSSAYPRTYAGLDQASANWPKTAVQAGQTLNVQYIATAPHNPSVWDVWMTKNSWDPTQPLTWSEMEFLVRPTVATGGIGYSFDITVPVDRIGHHVLWVAWQRDDAAGEVFISASDIDVQRSFALYPGSGDDLQLSTGSNGMLSTLPPFDVKSIGVNTDLTLALSTPSATFAGQPGWLGVVALTPSQVITPLFGLPDVYINPTVNGLLLTLPPLTTQNQGITFTIPAALQGQQFLTQGLSVGTNALNGSYAMTDGHLLLVR